MTTHSCKRCFGAGHLCGKCGKGRHARRRGQREWEGCRVCGSRSKPLPCPGEAARVGADAVAHFDTVTECDCCRARHLGYRPPSWQASTGRGASGWSDWCDACAKRHVELLATVTDRMLEERGAMNAGTQWRPLGFEQLRPTRKDLRNELERVGRTLDAELGLVR